MEHTELCMAEGGREHEVRWNTPLRFWFCHMPAPPPPPQPPPVVRFSLTIAPAKPNPAVENFRAIEDRQARIAASQQGGAGGAGGATTRSRTLCG